jgi:hypothetical protein
MNWMSLIFRAVADTCILPGTVNGSEILWLYLLHWKKEYSTFSFALISFLFSYVDFQNSWTIPVEHSIRESGNS